MSFWVRCRTVQPVAVAYLDREARCTRDRSLAVRFEVEADAWDFARASDNECPVDVWSEGASMSISSENKDQFAAVVATFPAEFGLRGFPGEVFRISEQASYFGDAPYGSPRPLMLYTERLCSDGQWHDFAKGTESEMRAQCVAAPAKKAG